MHANKAQSSQSKSLGHPSSKKHQEKHATWPCLYPIIQSARSEPVDLSPLGTPNCAASLMPRPPDSLHENCRDSRSQPRTVSGGLSGGGRSFAACAVLGQCYRADITAQAFRGFLNCVLKRYMYSEVWPPRIKARHQGPTSRQRMQSSGIPSIITDQSTSSPRCSGYSTHHILHPHPSIHCIFPGPVGASH